MSKKHTNKPAPKNRPVIKVLPRKTYFLPNTSVGKIQVFIPLETIKDTINTEWGTSDYYIAPDDFMSINTDFFNFGAVEFPGFTTFRKHYKTTIVCTKIQEKLIRENMELSTWPDTEYKMDLPGLYNPNDQDLVPDLIAESRFFSEKPIIDSLLNFHHFDTNNKALLKKRDNKGKTIGEVEITKTGKNEIHIHDRYSNIDYGKFSLEYTPPEKIAHENLSPLKKYYKEKNLKITEGNTLYEKELILSSGSGFDPYNNNFNPKHRYGSTTGAAYFDRNGDIVLVDPPVNTIYFLLDSKINLYRVKGIIITHLHEDHDGGFFQTIMNLPQKVPVYMTKMNMLKEVRKIRNNLSSSRKSESDIKITDEKIMELIEFRLIDMKEPIKITEDYSFEFFHTWHFIETIGFYVINSNGAYVSYWSGDTQLSPDLTQKAVTAGIMTPRRREQLINLKKCLHYSIEMGRDNFFHNSKETVEAIIKLNQINPKNITIVHTTTEPDIEGVTLAMEGMTIDLSDQNNVDKFRITNEVINLINSIPALSGICKDTESLGIFTQNFKMADDLKHGDLIFRKGDKADCTYFYLDGGAGHIVMDKKLEEGELPKVIDAINKRKPYPGLVAHRYQRGTILGEGYFSDEQVRTKYVYAIGKPRYLKLTTEAWDKILESNTNVGYKLKRLLEIRKMDIPYAIALSPIFWGIDLPIIEELISKKGKAESWEKGTYLISQNQQLDYIYIITKGKVKITQRQLAKGKLIGDEIILKEKIEIKEGKSSLLVGEISLLEGERDVKTGRGYPKQNVIVTSEEAEVIAIERNDIFELTKKHPRIGLNLQILSIIRQDENKTTIEEIVKRLQYEKYIQKDEVDILLLYDESSDTYHTGEDFVMAEDVISPKEED